MIGRFFAHPGDDHSEKEGEARGDEGDDRCLHLEQGKIPKDERVPDGRRVEVAQVGDKVAVRHSRRPRGNVLYYSQFEWSAFLDGAKKGEFDKFVGP